ncbi:MAG: AAA family ATPase [Bacilli bacterium]|nr:AAA family ATPase [Bacilli bacterium]
MVYLKKFELLNDYQEHVLTEIERRRIFNNYYPLGIFPLKEFKTIEFDNITIFYGGNGSGKSTLLNIISEKLEAERKSRLDKGSYFDLYVEHCDYNMTFDSPLEIKLITSDDVFDYLLDVRAINSNVNRTKERLGREYLNYKFEDNNSNFNNYEQVKNSYESKRKTMSKYIRDRLGNNNIIEQSNGESALLFWEREIKENSIYFLDEPENSLSAENQLKLKKFIEDSARFYNCQFIISTHSPFLLDLECAKIYDLDSFPVTTKKWNELENIKMYYNFFKERENQFDGKEY